MKRIYYYYYYCCINNDLFLFILVINPKIVSRCTGYHIKEKKTFRVTRIKAPKKGPNPGGEHHAGNLYYTILCDITIVSYELYYVLFSC